MTKDEFYKVNIGDTVIHHGKRRVVKDKTYGGYFWFDGPWGKLESVSHGYCTVDNVVSETKMTVMPWDGPIRSSRFFCTECASTLVREKCINCGTSHSFESDGVDRYVRRK